MEEELWQRRKNQNIINYNLSIAQKKLLITLHNYHVQKIIYF